MRIANEKIIIETNEYGEIKSISFDGNQMLHDGINDWQKVYPMIWPVTSISKSFEVDSKKYEIPKHGFWKQLNWRQEIKNNTLLLNATHVANDIYPFSIEINHEIKIVNNKVLISTTFKNIGNSKAAFNFGHHPAFKIDDISTLSIDKENDVYKIGFDGSLVKENIKLEKISDMKFGIDYDTLVIKKAKGITITLKNKTVVINIFSNDFDSLQFWKPKNAKFICVEPWQGYNDSEYDYPSDAFDKKETIILESLKEITKSIEIEFK